MAAHSSVLAWEIPWTEEPGSLASMGSQRVRHDLAPEHALMHIALEARCLWMGSPTLAGRFLTTAPPGKLYTRAQVVCLE